MIYPLPCEVCMVVAVIGDVEWVSGTRHREDLFSRRGTGKLGLDSNQGYNHTRVEPGWWVHVIDYSWTRQQRLNRKVFSTRRLVILSAYQDSLIWGIRAIKGASDFSPNWSCLLLLLAYDPGGSLFFWKQLTTQRRINMQLTRKKWCYSLTSRQQKSIRNWDQITNTISNYNDESNQYMMHTNLIMATT